MSVRANGPKTVALVGERTHDAKLLRVGPWVRDRLLLVDPAYYSPRVFAKIRENGGFFVFRWKRSADPLFLRSLAVHRGRAIDLDGERLSEVLPHLQPQTLDAEAERAFRRRIYNGQRSGDTPRCRRVAVWDEAGGEYHLYLTNVGPEPLIAEEVARLYAMRWEIELVFKELNSHYALDEFRTTNANVVEALIWSAVLTLVVSRRLHTRGRRRAPAELRPRYTRLRFAVNFRRGAGHILSAMLYHLGASKDRGSPRGSNLYLVEAPLDPHVKRHRFREEWSR